MMQSKKIKFSDITKLPKGQDNIPANANAIVRDLLRSAVSVGVITADEYENYLLDLKDIEIGKWYGTWKIKSIHVTFRYGVCQSYLSLDKPLRTSFFDLNDVNHEIDFSKGKPV
jgi:hypothetical protein